MPNVSTSHVFDYYLVGEQTVNENNWRVIFKEELSGIPSWRDYSRFNGLKLLFERFKHQAFKLDWEHPYVDFEFN